MVFVLAAFALVSILGVSAGIERGDGTMSSCSLMASQSTICQMSTIEHISQWQQAFFGVPKKANVLALAMTMFLIAAISSPKPLQLAQPRGLITQLPSYHNAYLVKIFDPLLLAFSDGILNPKIYKPASA